MRHRELLNSLQILTGKRIMQKDIADALGVNINRISTRASRNSQYSTEEIAILNKKFNINILQEKTDNILSDAMNNVCLDYYPDTLGSCVSGKFIKSDIKEKLCITKCLIKDYTDLKTYSVINAFGDSMAPVILENDKLLIELFTNQYQIEDNCIYIFRYKNKLFCRRLFDNIKQLVIKSDSLQYEPVVIDNVNNDNDIEIIAKVVGLIRTW